MRIFIYKLIFFFLLVSVTEALEWKEPINIVNPKIVVTKQAPVSRKKVGIKGDYKPAMAILPRGELLLTTYRAQMLKDGKVLEEIVFFRSIDNGESWSTGEIMKNLPGREPYITALKDGTLLMTCHLLPQDIKNPTVHVKHFIHRSIDEGRRWETREIDLNRRNKNMNLNTSRNIITMDDGSLLFLVSVGIDHYFYEDEFASTLHIEKLCEEVKKDIEVKTSGKDSCISTLNSLLRFPGLYEQLVLKRGKWKLSGDAEDLLRKTNDWRLKLSPATFNEYNRNIIVRLNRQLLEDIYPRVTPKTHNISDLNYRFLSYDNGKTWSDPEKINVRGDVPKVYKDPLFGEAYLFKATDGTLYAIARVDSRYFPMRNDKELLFQKIDKYWDHYERMVLFRSKDGINWHVDSDLLSYGEMYPSIIRLYHNVLMLTYTVKDLSTPLGVRAIIGTEREGKLFFNRNSDLVMIDTKTPPGQDSGGDSAIPFGLGENS